MSYQFDFTTNRYDFYPVRIVEIAPVCSEVKLIRHKPMKDVPNYLVSSANSSSSVEVVVVVVDLLGSLVYLVCTVNVTSRYLIHSSLFRGCSQRFLVLS